MVFCLTKQTQPIWEVSCSSIDYNTSFFISWWIGVITEITMASSTPAEDIKMKVMGLNIFPVVRTFLKLQEWAKMLLLSISRNFYAICWLTVCPQKVGVGIILVTKEKNDVSSNDIFALLNILSQTKRGNKVMLGKDQTYPIQCWICTTARRKHHIQSKKF